MRVSLVGVFYLRGGVAAFGLLGESGGETAHSAHITHSPLEMEILVIFSGGGGVICSFVLQLKTAV